MSSARYIRTPGVDDVRVEIGKLSYGDFTIRASNFKRRTIVFTGEQMRAFIDAVKQGHFDPLFEEPR
jgi:hypothetical protein